MTDIADVVARLTHTSSQANVTMTVDVADMRALLTELRQACDVVALDVAEHTAVAALASVTHQYAHTTQGFAETGRAQSDVAGARLEHAAARDAWITTHAARAGHPVAEVSLARAVADSALDLQDAAARLAAAASTGDTTAKGALTAAAQRHLDTTHPVLVHRLQNAQQAHDDSLTAYRKRTR